MNFECQMYSKVVFLLSITLLVSLANGRPQKRQQSVSCRAKWSELKDCFLSMMQKEREVIALLKEDRLEEGIALANSLRELPPACTISWEQYNECCAAEGDCSLFEAEKEALETEIIALDEEMNSEGVKATLRSRQRMNDDK